jgi:hypothetical protein
VAGALAAAGLGLPAASAAWTTPAPVNEAVRDAPVVVAGDGTGNAFALLTGSRSDLPLLLTERPASDVPPGGAPLTWEGSRPLPGGVPEFTTAGAGVDAVAAAGGGDGSAVIALRTRRGGGDLVALLARDAGLPFSEPVTVGGARLGRLGPPVAAVAPAGTAVVAFTATRRGVRRVVAATRRPRERTGSVRTLSAGGAGSVAATTGPGERALVVWTRGTRAEAAGYDDVGRPARARTLGGAARGSPIAAAGSPSGTVVTWVAGDRTLRLVRRSAAGRFGAARVVTPAGPQPRDLVAALDPNGLAVLAWLEGSGATTRLVVAVLPPRGAARILRPASGAGLGPPGLVARPRGGAAIAWAAPTGWTAQLADAKGTFTDPAVLDRGAPVWRERPFVLAGPQPRVDVLWIEPTADSPGAMTLAESFEYESIAG